MVVALPLGTGLFSSSHSRLTHEGYLADDVTNNDVGDDLLSDLAGRRWFEEHQLTFGAVLVPTEGGVGGHECTVGIGASGSLNQILSTCWTKSDRGTSHHPRIIMTSISLSTPATNRS